MSAAVSTSDYSGVPAALPLSAAIVLLLARWLPIEFSYHPNPFGIVSPVTLARYPVQQETFWLLFALVASGLVTWGLSRILRCSGDVDSVIRLEAVGAAGLLSVLFLPTPLGAVACAASVAGALWIVRRAPTDASLLPHPIEISRMRSPWRGALWLLAVVVAVLLLLPDLWVHAWIVREGITDDRLANGSFEFQAEVGQHLAWANSLWHGGLPGKDYFTLYGPLYDLGLVALWQQLGRSIAAFDLQVSLARLFGWLGFVLLARVLLRSWIAVLLVPFLLSRIDLRIGLALFALSLLILWLRGGRRSFAVASGGVAGVALLYSQEFGLAFALTAAVAMAVRRDARAALAFGAGLTLSMVPVLGWLHSQDALVPMLRDLVAYPRYMMAGYAKHPFPALASSLPLSIDGTRVIRYAYALPVIGVSALLLALPVSSLDPRRPLASLRRLCDDLARDPVRLAVVLTAIFGLIAFRSAMGRSSLARSVACAAPMALLLAVGIERGVALWRSGGVARRLAHWRLAALAVMALLSGMAEEARPLTLGARTVHSVWTLATKGHHPTGRARVMRVVRWIQLHTEPGEPVLFLPNDAAYYYLVDRPNPIRFVLGSQIVTEAHRREVLADLQRNPPRYMVWDTQSLRGDDLPDEAVFGEELMRWLEERYAKQEILGAVEIWRWIETSPGDAEIPPGSANGERG